MDLGHFGAFSVRHWQFTLVIFAGLVLMGFSAFNAIPRQEDPTFPIPVFLVSAILPGADPADMETLVIDPVEDALNGVDDLKQLRSVALDGVAVITVEFDWEVDAEDKYDEVIREVNAIRPNLPAGLARFDIDRVGTRRTSIVQMALVSETASYRALREAAEDLEDALDRVPGVWETDVWGAPQTEVRVAVDLGRLAELGLPLDAVAAALRAEGADVTAGAVHAGARRFNVKGVGAFDTLDEIGATVVIAAEGRTIRVRDVASVEWAEDEPTHLTWYNGERAVFITATQKDQASVFDVREAIYAAADGFEAALPAGVRLERGFDQSQNVAHRLGVLARDFSIALGLVLITLLPLGLRAAIVVMLSIPLALAIGVAGMHLMSFSLNQLSIAGFVLALGLLVDDAIVVTENIARHLRMGKSRTEAAIDGMRQIAVAVVGCTATLMLAFVPLLFLPEGAGKFIKVLPIAVLLSVGASLVIALTIIPFLASRLLSRDENPEGNAVLRVTMGFIHGVYRPVLHVALMRPWMTLGVAAAIFIATMALGTRIGTSLFPPADTPQFLINIDTPDGTALAETGKALDFVEDVLRGTPEVRFFMSNLGRGNPQVFYNVIPEQSRTNHASVMVELTAWEGEESHALLDRLRARFAEYPGAQIITEVFVNGPPIEAPIALRILGPDLGTLSRLAADATRLIETTPGARDVVNPIRLERTDLDLGLDYDRAAALGVPAGAVDRTVRLALEGEPVARFREDDGDDYPVVVRLPFELRNDLGVLERIYVPAAAGAAPLGLVAAPEFVSGPARIDRFNRERSVTITAYAGTGYLASGVTAEIAERLGEIDVPPGYTLDFGGQAEAQARSFAGLGNAVLLAVFGIFAVLILEFRSFAATAVVAGVIPLGIIGGVLALWLTGYSLSFTATLGFIALIGIEIKNSILLVDFTTQLRRQGVPLREAIEEAGEVRFLPVLLTSVTAIGGLTPLALEGSGLYSPLAVVIIGGLITSTILSRVVTPAMYLLLAPSDEKFHAEEAEHSGRTRPQPQPAE